MLLSLIPAATVSAYDQPPEDIKVGEWKVLAQMNKARERHGLAPLRMATRVRLVARDRARSMKNQAYFGHVSPSGVDAADMMRRRGIKQRTWGENIGWAGFETAASGARDMVKWWMESPGHRYNILYDDFNYAGVGIAKGKNSYYYVLVLVNQRDHTPPKAGLIGSQTGISVASLNPSAKVTVQWWGRDRRLATRTAGLRGFAVHYKRGDGKWRPLYVNTSKRSLTRDLSKGVHAFRVRATDRQGNRGSWMRPLQVVVS
jgi:hypothetical protein